MRLSHILSLGLPFVLLLGCANEHLPVQRATAVATLRTLVDEDLDDVARGGLPSNAAKIRETYAAVDRRSTATSADDLVEMKYLLADYREAVAAMLVHRADGANQEMLIEIVNALAHVGTYLDENACDRLWDAARASDAPFLVEWLLAEFGADAWVHRHLPALATTPNARAFYDGPGHNNTYGNDGWVGNREFALASYGRGRSDDGPYSVRLRGIEFRSGDVLLLDQGKNGGVNTNFSLVRSFASHVGLVVFLEKGGTTYPAFFEIAERGLRVIPLASAITPEFLYSGAELYRPGALPRSSKSAEYVAWAKAFSADVQARLPRRYHYDYDVPKIVTGEELGVVCSTQVQLFLKRAGIVLDAPSDSLHPLAQATLASQFKYPLKEYVTPTSLIRGGGLRFVGFVDTGTLSVNLARELVIGTAGEGAPESLGYLFSHQSLDLAKVTATAEGARFSALRAAAPLLLATGPYRVKAPSDVLAFAKTLEGPLERAADTMLRKLPELRRRQVGYALSLGELAAQENTRAVLRDSMAPIRAWFVAPKP